MNHDPLMKSLVGAATVVCSLCCHAAPDKLAYELQERCGIRASVEFKREFGTAGTPVTKLGATSFHNFQNHYNSRMNACIYLIRSSGFTAVRINKPGDGTKGHEMQALFNLNENKELGSYFKFTDSVSPMQCQVGSSVCRSKEEWEVLIRPYLEE